MLSRRHLLAAPAVIGAAGALPARAAAPLQGASPPAHRFRIGETEVTALGDGVLPIGAGEFPAAKDPREVEAVLALSGRAPGPIPTWVNAYLVNTGERLILVDTGTGGPAPELGGGLGRLPANLAAAGVDPKAVDLVVLTHVHPDHAGGLSPGGSPAFPNAEVVLLEAEHGFWTDEGVLSRAPAEMRPFFDIARASLRPYAARTRRVGPGEVARGVSLEAAPGHTPGHALVRIASGKDQLLILGDLVHAAALQFERPDWSIAFDVDQAEAARTRRRVLDMAAADRLLVAGMHLPFPGLGRVARRGQAYAYTAKPWPA